MTREVCMPRPRLQSLLERDADTLTEGEQMRLAVAMVRTLGYRRPLDRVYKHEFPVCGARCRDGHPCQAKAAWDETRCYVRNGRCRLHGGLSTGPKTAAGKRRIGEAARRRAQHQRQGDRQVQGREP